MLIACSKNDDAGPVVDQTQSLDSLFLSCDPETTEFTSKGGSQTVRLITGRKWNITSKSEWITVSPMEGKGEQEIVITALPNIDRLHNRSHKLSIWWDAGEGPMNNSTYVVNQQKDSLQVTPMSFFINGFASNGEQKLTITTAAEWKASSNQTWCRVDKETGVSDGDILLILDENNTLQAREAIVKIERQTNKTLQQEKVNVVVQQQSRNLPFVYVKSFRGNAVSSYTVDVEFSYSMGVAGEGYTSQPVTEIGVCYSSTTSLPDINNSTVKSINLPSAYVGTIKDVISGLLPGTKYYIRAYARCSYGIGYSQVVYFDTK